MTRHYAMVVAAVVAGLVILAACSAPPSSDDEETRAAAEEADTTVVNDPATSVTGQGASTLQIATLLPESVAGAFPDDIDPLRGEPGFVTEEATFEIVGEVPGLTDAEVFAGAISTGGTEFAATLLVLPGDDVSALRVDGMVDGNPFPCLDVQLGDGPVPGLMPGPLPVSAGPADPIAFFVLPAPDIETITLTLYAVDPAAGTFTSWVYATPPLDGMDVLALDAAELDRIEAALAPPQEIGCSVRATVAPDSFFTRDP